MASEKILVIDDEADIAELIRYNLAKEGYEVSVYTTGDQAYQKICSEKPGLVVLDLMLPGMSGLDICRLVRKNDRCADTPIIMLTAKGEEADVVTGLELGADDYITKPFSTRVLIARVRTVLRRKQPEAALQSGEFLKIQELAIDRKRYQVTVQGAPLDLTSSEYKLLLCLAEHPGWVFTRNQIVKFVHGDNYPVTDRSVDVQVNGLRKKLGPCADYIETVRGIGYRFRE